MMKRVDVAVFETIKAVKEGSFKGGVVQFGLNNKGVDYSVDAHNEKLMTAAIKAKAEEVKAQIISGKIKVPDYYKQSK
jgi:basic membrane protein A